MLNKLNVFVILKDHWLTLAGQKGDSAVRELVTFGLIPAVLATLLIRNKVFLSDGSIGILLASFSILTGLLFNLLILLFDLIQKEQGANLKEGLPVASQRLKLRLLNDTFCNISFCVLLALSLSVVSIVAMNRQPLLLTIASWIVYAGGSVFFLTLLMVLKRVHTLFSEQLPKTDD